MAVVSPALPLASTAAQSFEFVSRSSVLIQVRFYTTATGDAGSEMNVAAAGSRDVTVSTLTRSAVSYTASHYDTTREYNVTDVESGIFNNTLTLPGATWGEFGLGPGLNNCIVSASGGADPGGALSYRIWVDVEPNRSP